MTLAGTPSAAAVLVRPAACAARTSGRPAHSYGSEDWGSCARWHPGGMSGAAMKRRWSSSRTSVTLMCITTQRRNQPYAG